MILQLLDDTFKHMRSCSRRCEINECSCSNAEIPVQDELAQRYHQRSQPIDNHARHRGEDD